MSESQTFTLVPVGGLGNRIVAICSAISFCIAKQRNLVIIWFKDQGLNCNYDKLIHLDTPVDVQIRNAKGLDFILRDKPRKRNLRVTYFFEKILYDKCIYYYDNTFKVQDDLNPVFDRRLDDFRNVYMVACWKYWISPEMYKWVKPTTEIERKVKKITDDFPENIIGLHIRRADNAYTIKHSPTEMFIESIENEIKKNKEVKFYLASDSMSEKEYLLNMYGDRIITLKKESVRNTEKGIIDAFVEMNVLSRTKRIYAGASSFALVSASLSGTELIRLGREYKYME